MAEETSNLVTINIDGKDYSVAAKQNLISAAQSLGIEIPHYCYHPKLPMAGSCRMCLVEIGMPMRDRKTGAPVMDEATGKQKIGWMPKPAIACGTNVSPGLHVRLHSKLTTSSRECVTEFLLVNHPLDCPICDQAGECTLQEFSSQYGKGVSRYRDEKNVKPKHRALGPRVMYDGERCIRCTRCVRFCRDVLKKPVLGVVQRGSHSYIDTYPGMELDGNYSMNVVDVCPVGAMTSRDFRFKMRVWFLKRTKSICTESSVGVNTTVWSREGKIYRITPRENDFVNVVWMSDSGRMLYKTVASDTRLKGFRRGETEVTLDEAVDASLALIKNGAAAFVASGKMSVEEQYLLKKLAEVCGGNVYLTKTLGGNDGMLISEDRSPNRRGALVTGLVNDFDSSDVALLAKEIDAGNVKTVFVCGEDLKAHGFTDEQLKKVDIVYLGTAANATSAEALVILPSRTVFEKAGTFINQEFRLQKFAVAVPGLAGTEDDVKILSALAARAASSVISDTSVPAVWEGIRKECKALAGIDFATIPDTGTVLDASPWAKIAFPETGSLVWKPAQKTVGALK